MKIKKAEFWLRVSFLLGLIIDALALVPMLIPGMSRIFWGFDGFTGIYYFAMGMGASLMLAWTILLYWAYRKPLERRYIALLTILIILGIVATEIFALSQGYIHISKIMVSLVIQAVLIAIFGYGFSISGSPEVRRISGETQED